MTEVRLYSSLSASMGSSLDAFQAGYAPAITLTLIATSMAARTVSKDMTGAKEKDEDDGLRQPGLPLAQRLRLIVEPI